MTDSPQPRLSELIHTRLIGHKDRVSPLRDYCRGLTSERKSVELGQGARIGITGDRAEGPN